MSDLFCAASLLVVRSGEPGAESALDGVLPGLRVAAVWTTRSGRVTADAVAAHTGATVTVREDLGDESALAGVIEELADTFRGETVAVVGETRLIAAVLAEAVNTTALPMLQPGQSAAAQVDADGLVLHRWADTTLDG